MYNIFILETTQIYYNSITSQFIEEGRADLHCRSDKYLAEDFFRNEENYYFIILDIIFLFGSISKAHPFFLDGCAIHDF